MPDDLLIFLGCVVMLTLYLCWSAATEMGTTPWRWPWQKHE